MICQYKYWLNWAWIFFIYLNLKKLSLAVKIVNLFDVKISNFRKTLLAFFFFYSHIFNFNVFIFFSLEDLKLIDCSIESIYFDEAFSKLDKVPIFCKLKCLDLKNNHLKEWKDITNLSKLVSLQELTLKGNPLFESLSFDYSFNFVLSMIGGLQKLNRQEVKTNKHLFINFA